MSDFLLNSIINIRSSWLSFAIIFDYMNMTTWTPQQNRNTCGTTRDFAQFLNYLYKRLIVLFIFMDNFIKGHLFAHKGLTCTGTASADPTAPTHRKVWGNGIHRTPSIFKGIQSQNIWGAVHVGEQRRPHPRIAVVRQSSPNGWQRGCRRGSLLCILSLLNEYNYNFSSSGWTMRNGKHNTRRLRALLGINEEQQVSY